MKSSVVIYIVVVFLFLGMACSEKQLLFQEGSNSWEIFGDAKWTFADGILIGEARDEAGFVMTKNPYQDFILELEFKPDSTINSGVFVRCSKKEISATDCHEINIWDLHPNQDFRTGAIVSKSVPKAYVETLETWNSYRIQMTKKRVQVWVNDTQTADSSFEHVMEGYIALQAMGTGKIEFRNIKLKTLD